jgi:acyl-coenzyme A thioesterase PaaI-like protein
METQKTHLSMDSRLCGRPVDLQPGRASVSLETLPEMASDERGLVHGGFTFGMADYAAMLAVNDPNVVLGSAQVKFLKPVVVGAVLLAEAEVQSAEGKKRSVRVLVRCDGETVAEAELLCLVPDRHVLDRRV